MKSKRVKFKVGQTWVHHYKGSGSIFRTLIKYLPNLGRWRSRWRLTLNGETGIDDFFAERHVLSDNWQRVWDISDIKRTICD